MDLDLDLLIAAAVLETSKKNKTKQNRGASCGGKDRHGVCVCGGGGVGGDKKRKLIARKWKKQGRLWKRKKGETKL